MERWERDRRQYGKEQVQFEHVIGGQRLGSRFWVIS